LELIRAHLSGGHDLRVRSEVECDVPPLTRLHHQDVAVQRGDRTAHPHVGLCESSGGDEGKEEEGKPFHAGRSLLSEGEHPYSPPHSMLNPFNPLKKIEVQRFSSLPAKFRKRRRTAWSDPNRQGTAVDSFLEGPSFDRQGNLWCVDIPFGRIFKVNKKGEWDLAAQYDGWPNGLKIHRDGSIWIADYKKGLLKLDPKTGKIETLLGTAFSESFKGLNDLHFADNGDLYFTDQGQSGIADPSGRVWRLRMEGRNAGELQCLVRNAPSPNGITLNRKNSQVYVAITRAQQIWRLP